MMEMLSHPSAHFSMPYRHISRDDRKTIASLISGGRHNHSEIAEQIGKSPSAVSREIAAGSGEDGRYVPGEADRRSAGKRSDANAGRRKITEGSEAEKAVLAGLKLFWSPEQIAGRHLLDSGAPLASHVTVYAYVAAHGKDLFRYLRHGKGRLRRRRHGTKQREKRREEGKKRRIDARPDVVAARSRVGDWEGDTVVGQEKTVHVLTHVDRKTGYLYADVVGGSAEAVRRATERRFGRCPKKKLSTITYDNGTQFAEHETLERNLGIEVYFAHPYHSWERGTNENTNGLLRQFLPKGTHFAGLRQRKLDRYAKLINNRPGKRHGYRTPEEEFNCASD